MDIRTFSKLCLAIANGEEAKSLLPTHNFDEAAQRQLVQMAVLQRVLPTICQFIYDNPDVFREILKGSDALALQNPMHFKARCMRIKSQLLEIDHHLAGTTVKPVLLKGSILLFDKLYPSIAMRHMSDIDILCEDPRFGQALAALGYEQVEPDEQVLVDERGDPTLQQGEYHLPPVGRASDPVHIEPHLIPTSPIYSYLVPKNFDTDVRVVDGCSNLCQPNPRNHLIHVLIHALRHDRDVLDGGLLVRGLVDCELLYQKLAPQDRAACEAHFRSCGAIGFWTSWRALAEWAFYDDDSAKFSSVSAYLQILEFQFRARGHKAVFTVAFINRAKAMFNIRYWRSGTGVKHSKRLIARSFWERLGTRWLAVFRK